MPRDFVEPHESSPGESKPELLDRMVSLIRADWSVDAIYLYGSRARGEQHAQSDWDLGILFSDFLHDPLDAATRPQEIEAELQRTLGMYDEISVVDLERVSPPLQINIISGLRLYDAGVMHVRRVENAIASRVELDYA